MSKNNPDFSDLDPLAGKEYTEEQRKELEKEEKEFLNQTIQPQAMDTFFEIPPVPAGSTSSFSALSGNIAGDGYVDPITEAIRKEILEKQREELRKHLLKENEANPELKPNFENDEKFRDFLKTLNVNKDNKDLIDNALNNPDLKKTLEGIELAGYKNVHNTFSADNYRENKIKEEQEELLRNHIVATQPDLEEAKKKEDFRKFLEALNAGDRQALYDKALSDTKFKEQYENVRQQYTGKYVGGFQPMQWNASADRSDQKREQVVKNGVGNEICTLTETTHNTKPMTVTENGKTFTINSYRIIDFPVELKEPASGTMHLSLVARDKDGNAPPVDKAVYFTAHYEASPPPDGIPKLKEVSSPQPLKFLGTGDDAVGYVEHGGEIYTLPVTKGNYEAMMKEVAINKGQGVNISQTIAEDLIKYQEPAVTPQGKTLEAKSAEILSPQAQTTPPPTPGNQSIQPSISDMPKPQQGKMSEISNPVVNEEILSPQPKPVPPLTPSSQPQQPEISDTPQPQQPENRLANAAQDLSKAMQDFLSEYIGNMKKNKDANYSDLTNELTEKILGEKGASFDQKQAGINDLTQKLLGVKELPEKLKIEGLGKILEVTNKGSNLHDPEKAQLYGVISANVLDEPSLSPDTKKKLVEKLAESALSLNDKNARGQGINGITDAVIESKLNKDEKGNIFEIISKGIDNSTKLSAPEKNQLMNGVLDKGKEKGILSPEQQQIIQQNIDKIKEKQLAEEKIKSVQGILYNPLSDAVKKTEAIKSITVDVLDGPAKAEVKGEIIRGITKEVAQSPLDIKDQVGIIEGVGEAISSNKTVLNTEKAIVASFAEKGILESPAKSEDKELMTKGLRDGMHKGIESPEIKSEITQGVVKSINAHDRLEEKDSLKNAANLEIEGQSSIQNLNKDLPQNSVSSKVDKLRDILSGRTNFKTIEEKKAESEKAINQLVTEYKAIDEKYKLQYEQQKGSYDGNEELNEKKAFVDNLKLGDKDKLKLLDTLTQNEADSKRKSSIKNIAMLTQSKIDVNTKRANPDNNITPAKRSNSGRYP